MTPWTKRRTSIIFIKLALAADRRGNISWTWPTVRISDQEWRVGREGNLRADSTNLGVKCGRHCVTCVEFATEFALQLICQLIEIERRQIGSGAFLQTGLATHDLRTAERGGVKNERSPSSLIVRNYDYWPGNHLSQGISTLVGECVKTVSNLCP